MSEKTPGTSKLITGMLDVVRRGRKAMGEPRFLERRRQLATRIRYLAHRLEGMAYHVEGGRPDPDVTDEVLAQRVRSQLGPLQKRLDLPHLNVSVHDGVVTLRGAVGSVAQVVRVLNAVRRVSGVREVDSKLRVGFAPGDTRPSSGRDQPATSDAWRELVGAVRAVGVEQERPTGVEDDTIAERLTAAILAAFVRTLPDGERAHFLGHLPRDVRRRVTSSVFVGNLDRPRTTEEFLAAVLAGCAVRRDDAEMAVRELLSVLRTLVPEEVRDVEAVLPGDLKELWRAPLPTAG